LPELHERSPRYSLKLQIVYDDGNAFMSGAVVDISETGVFIETVMPLEPGTEVRLTPLLPEEAGLFEIIGVVVRKNDYDLDNHFDRTPGMGIRFKDVGGEAKAQLEKLFGRGKKKTT
jgi:Tfp pilus assembly protein PilZ